MRRSGESRLATLLLLAVALVPGIPRPADAQGSVPIHSWYSPSRGDNFATSDSRWNGRPGERRSPDYGYVRMEGSLLAPARETPRGAVPVYSWYSPSRGDNFLTSDPRWAGREGDTRSPDYRFVRLEGYLHDRPLAGTMPLQSFWDPDRGDNFATSDPRWIGQVGDRRSPNYRLYRTEGWVPAPPPGAPDLAPTFGYRRQAVEGERPLVVVLIEFADATLASDEDYFDKLFFGPDEPNIARYFSALSNGRFAWRKAGVVRVRFEEGVAGATADVAEYDREVTRRLARAGFDLRRYDADGNGRLTDRELGMAVIGPVTGGGGGGGQTRGRTVDVGGLQVTGQVSYTHENGDVILYAHELFHQLGFGEHIYGPGARLNFLASAFAANRTAGPGRGGVQLDPWHRFLTGWVKPRVFPVTAAAQSTTIGAAEPAPSEDQAPVVLYDPRRGTDEFFIVEYRTPRGPNTRAGGYDASVLGQGVAVWYVRKRTANTVFAFNWPPPISGPFNPSVGSHAYANYLIGPRGPGVGPFWTAANGEFALPWGDGTDSGFRLRVGPLSPTSGMVSVQWRRAEQPFLPRIDRLRPTSLSATATDAVLALDGVFPVSADGLVATLETAAESRTLEIASVAPTRMTVRVAGRLPAGSYRLHLDSPRGDAGPSNAVDLLVVPARLEPRPPIQGIPEGPPEE